MTTFTLNKVLIKTLIGFVQTDVSKPYSPIIIKNTAIIMKSNLKKVTVFLLIAVCFFGITQSVSAQSRKYKLVDSILARTSDTTKISLINKIASYTFTIDHTNFLIKNQLDVSPIAVDLRGIDKRLEGFKLRLERKDHQMNLRSLNTGTILFKEVTRKLSGYQNLLSDYSKQLSQSNTEVKKIIHDPGLNIKLADSVLSQQLQDIHDEGRNLDSLQRQTISHVNLLLTRVSISLLQANDIVSDMQYSSTEIKMAIWGKEEMPLFYAQLSNYHQSLAASALQALQRSAKIIIVFMSSEWNVLAISLLFFIFTAAWCLLNMYRIKKSENVSEVLKPVHLLRKHVLIGCLMAYFTYSVFFFVDPPMSLLHFSELLRLIAVSFLVFPFLTKSSKKILALLFVLWLYYALDDLFLETAFAERWALFIAGIALIIICLKLIISRKENFILLEESPVTKTLLIITLAQVILSVIFNITGRVTLSKIMGVSAIQCLWLGISLKIFSTMALEAIYLQSEAYSKSRFSNFINFSEQQHRLKRMLWIAASIVWGLSLVRNLTLYNFLLQASATFFNQQRSIGTMIFTFKSVAIFVLIIWFSSVISTVINFFFGNETVNETGERKNIGSIMLLIRLTIWTLGFLIAVAATGIPLDKLSFMIGALGVGIGFGLQNIVNNLASGIIIAFERPIQVGDLIEIGNKSGTVKEIGVRSSKIKSADGADIIIPNGDLLSQQLINWTMQDNKKRVDFILFIPYSADIETAKAVIQKKLDQNEIILQTPEPAINIQSFTDRAIEIKIMCWIPDLTKSGSVRTKLMFDIYEALVAAGVGLELPPSR